MSAIDVEERLRRLFEAEVTDDAEAAALARLRSGIARREYVAPASAPSGRRMMGIIGGASLVAAVGAAGAIAIVKHGAGTVPAPHAGARPSPPVVTMPAVTARPTPTAAPTPTAPPLAVYPSIDQLVMVSAKEGWAVAHGKVVRTTDGARTWTDVTPVGLTVPNLINPSAAFQVAALDAADAWVYDSRFDGSSATPRDAFVYRTVDGGRSWVRATVTGGGSFVSTRSLSMSSATVGFLLVDRGAGAGSEGVAVYRTVDGGLRWALMSEPSPTVTSDPRVSAVPGVPLGGLKSGIGSRDAQTAFAGAGSGGVGVLYQSQDGGVHWRQLQLSLPASAAASDQVENVLPPRFIDARNGWLDADIADPQASGPLHAVYTTMDGGTTWTGHLLPQGAGEAQAVDATRIAAVGADGAMYTSADGGVHWSSTGPHPGVAGSADPRFFNLRVGFVLVTVPGTGATSLWTTEDGGATFSRLGP